MDELFNTFEELDYSNIDYSNVDIVNNITSSNSIYMEILRDFPDPANDPLNGKFTYSENGEDRFQYFIGEHNAELLIMEENDITMKIKGYTQSMSENEEYYSNFSDLLEDRRLRGKSITGRVINKRERYIEEICNIFVPGYFDIYMIENENFDFDDMVERRYTNFRNRYLNISTLIDQAYIHKDMILKREFRHHDMSKISRNEGFTWVDANSKLGINTAIAY